MKQRIRSITQRCVRSLRSLLLIPRASRLHGARRSLLALRSYLHGSDVLQLSVEADFPPCMLMRRMLEHLLLPPLGGGGGAAAAPSKQVRCCGCPTGAVVLMLLRVENP